MLVGHQKKNLLMLVTFFSSDRFATRLFRIVIGRKCLTHH